MTKQLFRTALVLAVVFEVCILGQLPGSGYLGAVVITLLATYHLRRQGERRSSVWWWMFLPALLLGLSVTMYDSQVTRVWGTTVCLLALLWAMAWNLCEHRSQDILARLFPPQTFRPDLVLSHAHLGAQGTLNMTNEGRQKAAQMIRGALLSIPFLFVFGCLLISADPIFAGNLGEMVEKLSLAEPIPFLRTLVVGLLFLGWFRLWTLSAKLEEQPTTSRIPPVEMTVVLSSLNLLFLFFLVIQAHYLFGGSGHVESWGLNYAEYARRGFFELSACIGLLLPVVMLAYRGSVVHQEPRLRYLGGGLVLASAGLAASAFKRMLLYIQIFGLSIERFYAAAGILVALALLGWAGIACLRPRSVTWVLSRQTVTVLFLLGLLSLYNVDAKVADYNLDRHLTHQQDLDLRYLETLSADAVPVLDRWAAQAPPELAGRLRESRAAIVARTPKESGPSWNLSRARVLEPAQVSARRASSRKSSSPATSSS